MYTRRSFLAFAAAAQLISPAMRAAAAPAEPARRLAVPRLDRVLLQVHPGRDVHFHNDLAAGRLTILDMRHDAAPGPLLAGAMRAAGSRGAHDFYMYSLTRQPAIRDDTELRRYMEWYGAAMGGGLPPAALEAELLRLRFGVIDGDR